jgi:TonB family protein
MLWMLMAAATPPVLIKNSLVLHDRDYPTKMIEDGDAGVVSVHLYVTANGKVAGCKTTETSGSQALDALTCAIATRRARFTPAHDVGGQAVAGDYYIAVSWGTNSDVTPIQIPMQLGVKAIPPGYAQPAQMHVLFGGDGKPMRCDTAASSGSMAADRVICAAITVQANLAPSPKSGSDEPAAAMRTYVATLTTGALTP